MYVVSDVVSNVIILSILPVILSKLYLLILWVLTDRSVESTLLPRSLPVICTLKYVWICELLSLWTVCPNFMASQTISRSCSSVHIKKYIQVTHTVSCLTLILTCSWRVLKIKCHTEPIVIVGLPHRFTGKPSMLLASYTVFCTAIVSAVTVGGLFLWPAPRHGTGYQTVWETRPSAETPSDVHWRRFYFQLTCVHSKLELSGRCALQIYLLTYLLGRYSLIIRCLQPCDRYIWHFNFLLPPGAIAKR